MNSKMYFVTVVAVIHDKNARILVLKRRDDETVYPDVYTFPDGKMEGFENVEDALHREVLEETGL